MIVTAGKTNVSVYYYIVGDAGNATPGEPVTGLLFSDIETGGSASYMRAGGARVDLTLITLASASAAHDDGGFIFVDDGEMKGTYRCDYPDAVFAAGVDEVICQIRIASGKNAVAAPVKVQLTVFDLRDGVRGGMTALPNAAADAAGGLPISDLGGLDLDDIPITTEFEARTLAAAAYFDPAADAVANVTLVATTTTNTDMVAEAPALADIVDAVWDEIITGAAHNTNNSAGKRLRQASELGTYSGSSIYIDTVSGTAGTTDFEHGTDANPVLSLADAATLAASRGIRRFVIAPGSSLAFVAAQTDQVFSGENWTLALGGQDIDGSTFIGATVTGVGVNTAGTQSFINCMMGAVTLPGDTHCIGCGISGMQTMGEAGEFFYEDCRSAVAGTGKPTIDFGAGNAASNLHVRHHSGGWGVANMGAGAGVYDATFEGNGQIEWLASCSATSNASVRGNWKITDSAGGAVTVTLDDTTADVVDILADTNELQADDVPGLIAALNNISTAQVNAQVDLALTDIRLDELLAADSDIDGAAPPTVGSVFHELLTKSLAGFTYDQATDSLEALRDRGDAAWTTGGALTLDDIADAVWNEARAGHVAAGSFGEGVIVETNSDKTGYAIAVGGIAATAFAAGAINAAATSVDFVDEIWDKICEDQASITAQEILSIVLAACAGVTAGSVFKSPNGVSTRITSTLVLEERTVIVLAPSAGA